jgi:hypothetical protein
MMEKIGMTPILIVTPCRLERVKSLGSASPVTG